MNNDHSNPAREDETTILHLNQFAPGASSAAADSEPAQGATAFIRKAAAETVAENRKPVVVPGGAATLSPDELLGAVAYCYIKGVFSSADIERKMLRDLEFRAALDGLVPDPATIRRFRRLNRETIQVVLEKFYGRLRQQQKCIRETMPGAQPPPPCPPVADGRPRTDENTAVFVKREAIERLDKATFIDGMSDF